MLHSKQYFQASLRAARAAQLVLTVRSPRLAPVGRRSLGQWTGWAASLPRGFGGNVGGSSDDSAKAGKGGGGEPKGPKAKPDPKPRKPSEKPDFDPSQLLLPAATLVGAAALFALLYGGRIDGREISWQEFRNDYLSTGLVDRLEVVNRDHVRVFLRATPDPEFVAAALAADGMVTDPFGNDPAASGARGAAAGRRLFFRIGSVDTFERQLEDAQIDLRVRPRAFVLVRHTNETDLATRISSLLPTLMMLGLYAALFAGFVAMSGGGGPGGRDGISKMFNIGKVKPAIAKDAKVKVLFKDVAGCDEAKQEIMEFIQARLSRGAERRCRRRRSTPAAPSSLQFLKDPSRFTALGARIPKGALLVGPPGTGKTLLAKATAGESNVPFFSMSGSDFIEMFVGVGPSRVRDLFKQARESAPCIIFIDEIDAVARARNKGGFSGGNDERENTLNQLLVEMDGFSSTDGIVVLAGTNRVDILDKAILRPGRFDRQIQVEKPDIKGRKEIFLVHLAPIKVAGDRAEYAQRMAALTPGFVGADIANICNEAAIHAARHKHDAVTMKDFEAAVDRVIGGMEQRNSIMSPEERRTVAYHEAGHAVAGWFLEHADPLLKVTIIPRSKGALGFAQYLPKEVALYSREALLDRICMALGGRVAEELSFGGRVTTGASDDLDRVTQMAYAMTTVYGMNSRLGAVSFPRKDEQQFDKPYSDATAQVIDEEVRLLVSAAYARTKALLVEHAAHLQQVAELLLVKETISQNDIATIAGPRPWPMNPKLAEYVSQMWQDGPEGGAAAEGASAGGASGGSAAPSPSPA